MDVDGTRFGELVTGEVIVDFDVSNCPLWSVCLSAEDLEIDVLRDFEVREGIGLVGQCDEIRVNVSVRRKMFQLKD